MAKPLSLEARKSAHLRVTVGIGPKPPKIDASTDG
jgi:hypothetical protein